MTRVTDSSGRVLYDSAGKRTRVLDKNITDQVSWDLSGVIANGTGTGAEFGQPAAGKTGTTQDHRDAWFVGYTCSLTAAVWNGYVDNKPMDNVRGRWCSAAPTRLRSGASSWPRPPRGSSCPYDRPDDVSGRVGDITNDTTPTVSRGRPRPRVQGIDHDDVVAGLDDQHRASSTTTTAAPASTTDQGPVVPP